MKRPLLFLAAALLLASCEANPPSTYSTGTLGATAPISVRTNADFRRMARESMPGVVYIYSLKKEVNPSFISLLYSGMAFRGALGYWLHSLAANKYVEIGSGSGFFINKRGYILTNFHVVENADKIIVKARLGTALVPLSGQDGIPNYATPVEVGEEAEILGGDPLSDVALIKVSPDFRYKALPLGNSDGLDVGEWVAAIGNPYDVGKTFTAGVVSGLRREDIGILELEDFIQTDAAINPGNSGGPLIDIDGNVVGINSAIYSEASGVGLAVPINIAKAILPKLVNGERIDRGMLGVSLEDLTPQTAERLGVSESAGVMVIIVQQGSPAHRAGIRPLDIINSLDGQEVKHYYELKKAIVSLPAGMRVKVGIIRSGKNMSIEVKLGRLERKS